jgi:hypothetical protein
MGDATPPREHILCIIPFPEPTEIIKRIQKKHPNVDFSYIKHFSFPKTETDAVPDGNHIAPPFTKALLSEIHREMERGYHSLYAFRSAI